MVSASVTLGVPAIDGCLTSIRSQYQRALAGPAEDRSFSALGATLFVDQVRGVTVIEGNPVDWTARDGKACLDNTSPAGRIHLAPFVGAQRHLRATSVRAILHDIASGRPMVVPESVVARFVNLVVVEPVHRPEHEVVLWFAIAHQIAMGGEDELHAWLPPVISDHDVLHAQIPPGVPQAAALRPRDAAARETWPAFGVRLLAQLQPALAPRISELTDDDERTAWFRNHEAVARSEIHAQVLACTHRP